MRRLALAAVTALLMAGVAAWAAPAVLARARLEAEARAVGGRLELSPLWPAWPLGFRAESAALETPQAALELSELRAVLRGTQRVHTTARLGAGRIEVESALDGRSGQAFARELPLERIELRGGVGLELRGRLTGVARWGSALRFSARAANTRVSAMRNLLSLSADHVSVLGEWEPERRVTRIERLDAVGPSFDLSGEGDILESGELALRIELRRIEPRLMRVLQLLGIRAPERFPARYALVGPVARARLELLD